MPHGGKRAGAGRKSGADHVSKRPPAIRELARARVRQILQAEKDPLSVLVQIASNEDLEPVLRVQAASAACGYIHPKLSAAVVATKDLDSGRPDANQMVAKLSTLLARLAGPPSQALTIDADKAAIPAAVVPA